MTTIEQRINVALDHATLEVIRHIAKHTKKSMSKICAEFIKQKLEDDEDAYWCKELDKLGDLSKIKTISSEEFWGKANNEF